jgi:hypothetical protein
MIIVPQPACLCRPLSPARRNRDGNVAVTMPLRSEGNFHQILPIEMHQAIHGAFNPAATALAPPLAMVPAATSPRADVDNFDGLSRHRSDCNFGCIDY